MPFYQVKLGSLVLGTIYEQESRGMYGRCWVASPYKWEGRIAQLSALFEGWPNDFDSAKRFFLDKLPKECQALVEFVETQ